MKLQRIDKPRSTEWVDHTNRPRAWVKFSHRKNRWMFEVQDLRKPEWTRISHRHPTREAAETEGTVWAVLQALEP